MDDDANKPTVFVLGAGASDAVGYPLGSELKKLIINRLASTNLANEAILAGFPKDIVSEFDRHFAVCGLNTIDEFLAENHDLREIGKFLIAHTIMYCEQDEHLMARGQSSWYAGFRQFLGRGLDHLEQMNVKIITFNYDRSHLHFLYRAYGAVSRKPDDLARLKRLLAKLEFLPIHGGLSPLDWQTLGGRPYEQTGDARVVRASSKFILAPDERNESQAEAAQALIKNAKKVFFLGFGFDPQNMENVSGQLKPAS